MPKTGIVEYLGKGGSHCGYCGSNSDKKSVASGMWAHTLTVEDYQNLLDRGWRRSGKYCYKPDLKNTCCCLYTIRCEALKLSLSKSQKRVLKRMNHFLQTGERKKHTLEKSIPTSIDKFEEKVEYIPKLKETKENPVEVGKTDLEKLPPCPASTSSHKSIENQQETSVSILKPKYANKAKYKRLQIKLQKLIKQNLPPVLIKRTCTPKSVEEYMDFQSSKKSPVHKLEIRLVRSHPESDLFEETLSESFNIYKKYQMAVHKDTEITMRQFKRFLCESPLESCEFTSTPNEDALKSAGFGSFHQQYFLDNNIIAVGVIDILSRSVSAKYFYYDPDYSFLHLGIFSALVEAKLVRALNKILPQIEYYYLGFYLHDNIKMKYKGKYLPSYLLCPETYSWHPIEKCRSLLDQNKYCRFQEDLEKNDPDQDIDTRRILILTPNGQMIYGVYKRKLGLPNDEDDVKEYVTLVGHSAYSILLYRS